MAYVLPHMRKGNHARSPAADMLTPRFRRSLNFGSPGPKPVMDRSGKIVYADTAISGWFAVGLNDRELDFPNPVLRWVPQEQIKRMTGEKPLALVRGGSFSGWYLIHSGVEIFLCYWSDSGMKSHC